MKTAPFIIHNDIWNPYFYEGFDGFLSVTPFWKTLLPLYVDNWPTIDDFNTMKTGLPFRFVAQRANMQYLREINHSNRIPTRLHSWHDFFNNLSWMLWPTMKAAIIAQFKEKTAASKNGRTPLENWLTHFDECGAVICCTNEHWFQLLQQREWERFFLNRQLTEQCEMFIIGHGILEKSLAPYVGITAKAFFLPVTLDFFCQSYEEKMRFLDDRMAHYIANLNDDIQPKPLAPFPFLGWPNMWPENNSVDFFANAHYFRPAIGIDANKPMSGRI